MSDVTDYEIACCMAQEMNIPQKDRAEFIARQQERLKEEREARADL